ncbi:pilus assembly protein TadG-related protein [Geodermatophilus amargosae]|uniref:pilus assembly protein TadG-related protein n=1 Tax=Geodermatophilus amargosae TaxID=1296565 RepID=UPI0034DED890
MRRLTRALVRRLLPRRLAGERGASAIAVALLIVPLLGCGAIAVDVASLYSDRTQLRNGTDAAAIAIASDCARGACGNTASTATGLVTSNTVRARAARATTSAPTVSVSGRQVTVTASADQAHWFAPLLGSSSSRVTATSRASWAPTSQGLAKFPLVISWCEYVGQMARDRNGNATIRVNATTDLGSTDTCTGPDGTTQVPVGYAVTNGDNGNASCGTTSRIGSTVTQYTGMYTTSYRLPVSCTNAYLGSLIGTTVLVPIWDQVTGPVGAQSLRVFAYAAFYLEGYDYINRSDDPALVGRFSRAALPSEVGTPASVSRSATDLTTFDPAYRGAYSVFLDPQG